MILKYLGSRGVLMEIPAFTEIGEEFELEGERFTPGAVGKVTQIMGQIKGKTRVRIQLIEGRVLPESFASPPPEDVGAVEIPDGVIGEEFAEDENSIEVLSTKERFAMGMEATFQQGGRDLQDFDPRPRSGQQSQIIDQQQTTAELQEQQLQQLRALQQHGMINQQQAQYLQYLEQAMVQQEQIQEQLPQQSTEGSLVLTREQLRQQKVEMVRNLATPGRRPLTGKQVDQQMWAESMGMSIEGGGERRGGGYRRGQVPRANPQENPHDERTRRMLYQDAIMGYGQRNIRRG